MKSQQIPLVSFAPRDLVGALIASDDAPCLCGATLHAGHCNDPDCTFNPLAMAPCNCLAADLTWLDWVKWGDLDITQVII